jgi:hypothetical protein
MKKLFATLILVFGLTSCGVTVIGYDFDKVIADDQKLVNSFIRSMGVEANLIEAHGDMKSSPLEDLFNIHRMVFMHVIFQVGDNCFVSFVHDDYNYGEYPTVNVAHDMTWEYSGFVGSESDFGHDYTNTPRMNLVDAITYVETNDSASKVVRSVFLCTPTPTKTNNNNWYYVFCNKQDDIIKINGQTGKRCEL